ncbi:MAG: hypothetical protein NZM09_03910, partial [Ignavibacterium sp.]|nr:hypothetical protein [Ignavibacterium sp.]MDW8374825.1 hypothetical protein [Ignavibacteriales bacterium]
KDELKKKGLTDGQIERGSSLREQLNQITKDIADERRDTEIEQGDIKRKAENYESKKEDIERKAESKNPNEVNEAAKNPQELNVTQKSDIDKELDDAIKDFIDEFNKSFNRLNSFLVPIEPNLLLQGAKVVMIYCKKGVYKLTDILNDFMSRIGVICNEMLAAIKQAYLKSIDLIERGSYPIF